MSYRAETRPASFRGVGFDVLTRTREGGRRGALHEFADHDVPEGDDAGRRARRFRVDALVHGDSYFTARDSLLAALEAPGPGLYVDPWNGDWTVRAADYALTESDSASGGVARFTITFEEWGQQVYAAASAIDVPAEVAAAAAAVRAAAERSFLASFDAPAAPAAVRAATVAETQGIAAVLQRLGQGAPGDAALAGLASSTRGMLERTRPLTALATALEASAVTTLLALAFPRALPRIAGLLALVAALSHIAARDRASANQAALRSLWRRNSLAGAVAAVPSRAFDSFDDAAATRQQLADALDAELQVAGAETGAGSHAALLDLRVAMGTAIDAGSVGLARLTRLRLPRSLPAVVVAHRLYGDGNRGPEIARRNAAAHPGFLPATLEVLAP